MLFPYYHLWLQGMNQPFRYLSSYLEFLKTKLKIIVDFNFNSTINISPQKHGSNAHHLCLFSDMQIQNRQSSKITKPKIQQIWLCLNISTCSYIITLQQTTLQQAIESFVYKRYLQAQKQLQILKQINQLDLDKQYWMHFPARTANTSRLGITANRSRTPVKISQNTPLRKQKQIFKPLQTSQVPNNRQSQSTKYKSKDTMVLIQNLQDIYTNLTFNQFEAFPIDNIFTARQRISQLYKYYKGQPICPKHQDLLNLYCQSQKQMVCVSCVYKGSNQHKNHKIKALEAVQKTLDLQTIRNQEKCKSLVHQLSELKQLYLQTRDQIQRMQKEISQQYTLISNYTMRMFEQAITQLDSMKREMEKKLNLAFRRTITVISRYKQALEEMTNMIDSNIQRSISVTALSKHLILRSVLAEGFLIDQLIGKFNENKQMIQQWKRSTKEFEKTIVKKKFQPAHKVDTYTVTEF